MRKFIFYGLFLGMLTCYAYSYSNHIPNQKVESIRFSNNQLLLQIEDSWVPVSGILHLSNNFFEVFGADNEKLGVHWKCSHCGTLNIVWRSNCKGCGRHYSE